MIVKIFSVLYKNILIIFSLLTTIFLLAIATTSSCYVIAHYSEINFLVNDNLLINIVFISFLFLAILLCKKLNFIKKINNYINANDKTYKIIKYSLLFLILLFSISWVFLSQKTPNADAGIVQHVVNSVRSGDLQDFKMFGYLSRYPNNLGLFMISYFLSLIFGVDNYIAFGILNSIGIMYIYLTLSNISALFGFSKFKQLLVIFLGTSFLPLILYSTFIYGNVMGLTFSLLSFKYEMLYLKEKLDFKNLFLSFLFMTISILFKMNYLISLIAAIIYALSINIINKNDFKYYFIIVALLLSYVFSSILPNIITEKITGGNLHTPIQKTSYVAMGLDESPRGPGWYTGYNQDIYYQYNGNIKEIREQDLDAVLNRINYFLNHKGYAFKFFTQKIATTWNNPLFQSFWINQTQNNTKKTNSFVNYFLSVKNTYTFSRIYKFFEIFIYLGVFFYLIFNDNNVIATSLLLLLFIGNFVFLIFWETKSQYALTSFVVLFPLSIEGYSSLYRQKQIKKKFVFLIMILSLVVLLFQTTWIHEFLSKDSLEFEYYLRWPEAIFEKYQ